MAFVEHPMGVLFIWTVFEKQESCPLNFRCLCHPHAPCSPVPGKELVLFLRPRSQLRLSADLDALDLQGFRLDRDLARVSTDSGIERDLPLGSDELPDRKSVV